MRCKYFGKCGGCFYSLPYEEQLVEKKKLLKEIFGKEISIVPSPKINGYRSRMDFVYAFGKLGLRKRGSYKYVVDIAHCNLISSKANDVLKKIRNLLKQHQIEDYNYIKHKGYLRYVILREAKFTKEIMVNFLTASNKEDILPIAQEISKAVNSVIWSINSGLADVSFGEVYRSFKKDFIVEKLGKYRYKIGANTFFQSNPYMFLKILETIKELVSGNGLDLYCGIGSIALFISENCKSVIGVESMEESVKLANENAKLNNVKNANFVNAEVKDFLRDFKDKVDFIIADPPRSGMGKKVCERIIRLKPKKLILMSCNPLTLKQDLEFFKNFYKINFMRAYDMFPHTNHLEMLCFLEKR